MRVPRIYQLFESSQSSPIELNSSAAQHLIKVLRLKVDAEIILFNGMGGHYRAIISTINKQRVFVELKSYQESNLESPLNVHLAQGISRGEKMDYTIQKAVELGVNEITPIFTERCGVKLTHERWEKRIQHWQAVAIAACEQSGRDKLPLVHQPKEMIQWIKNKEGSGCRIILHPDQQNSSRLFEKQITHVSVIAGPEGGFSARELDLAKQYGFISFSLGPRILRTETAALAFIAVLQAKWGDFVF